MDDKNYVFFKKTKNDTRNTPCKEIKGWPDQM